MLYIAGKPVDDPEELTRFARERVGQDPNTRVVIQADRRAEWGRVIRVVDRLKVGGISKLAFAVEPMPRP
jgi:biopolymer transport protein ExbD